MSGVFLRCICKDWADRRLPMCSIRRAAARAAKESNGALPASAICSATNAISVTHCCKRSIQRSLFRSFSAANRAGIERTAGFLLNDVIVHLERLQATAGAFTPSDAVQKLEAEIRQTLERGTFNKAVFHQNMTVNRMFCHHFCLFSDFFGRQNGRPAVAGRPFCLTDITHI